MFPYKNMKVKVQSSDGETDFFDIVAAGVLQGDTLASYLFIICLVKAWTTINRLSIIWKSD